MKTGSENWLGGWGGVIVRLFRNGIRARGFWLPHGAACLINQKHKICMILSDFSSRSSLPNLANSISTPTLLPIKISPGSHASNQRSPPLCLSVWWKFILVEIPLCVLVPTEQYLNRGSCIFCIFRHLVQVVIFDSFPSRVERDGRPRHLVIW